MTEGKNKTYLENVLNYVPVMKLYYIKVKECNYETGFQFTPELNAEKIYSEDFVHAFLFQTL